MDDFAQSGDSGSAGTSTYVTGTVSDAGGGSDYVTDFLKVLGQVGVAAVSPRTSPAVQPQLTTTTPVQQPGSNAAAFSVSAFVAANRVPLMLVGGLALAWVAYKTLK